MVSIEESKLCRCSVPFSSICTIACSFEGWFHTISQFFYLVLFWNNSRVTKTSQTKLRLFKFSKNPYIQKFFFFRKKYPCFFSLLLTFSNATHEAAHSVLCEILGYMGCQSQVSYIVFGTPFFSSDSSSKQQEDN